MKRATIWVPISVKFDKGVKPAEVRDAINGIGYAVSSLDYRVELKPSVKLREVKDAMDHAKKPVWPRGSLT